MCDNPFFYDRPDGLRPGTYLSALGMFMIFMTNFGFGINLSGVTLFDELNKEEFDRG